MKIYLWVMLILYIIAIIRFLCNLGGQNYPRIEYTSAGDDVIYLLFCTGLAGWVAFLLF